MQLVYYASTPTDTDLLGSYLAKHLGDNILIALDGPMASGKTALSRAILEELGFRGCVSSPTFTIINKYVSVPSRLSAYHIDAYRLESSEELMMNGFGEFIFEALVTIVEWAELVSDVFIPSKTIYISIDLMDENSRMFTITTEDKTLYSFLQMMPNLKSI
jgi:tRNA threonylcarbamoyladenosine biosynthesis protein TsaE